MKHAAMITLLLDPSHPEFADLMLLVDWVEQQRAITRYGYPKDNAFPDEPLEERLGEEAYVRALLEAAREDDHVSSSLVDALDALLNAL